MKIHGDLVITSENAADYSDLTSVGGYLDISGDVSVEFPQLTSVGGYLYIRSDVSVEFPQLTSVGGYEICGESEISENLRMVAKASLMDGCLEMDRWHTCETTHCIAGWAAHLIPRGKEIERATSTSVAGTVLLGVEAAKHFHVSNEVAKEFLSQFMDGKGVSR